MAENNLLTRLDGLVGKYEEIELLITDPAVIADMRAQAHAIGAHAIVGISFSFNEFSGAGKSMLFVAATGTAVELHTN